MRISDWSSDVCSSDLPWITSTKTILDSGMEASRCPSTHIVDATMPKPSNAGTRIPTRSTSHPATGIDTATPTAAGARRSPTSWASRPPDHLQLNRKKVETDELGQCQRSGNQNDNRERRP